MKLIIKPARAFLALAIVCFGIHYVFFAALPGTSGAKPGPPWFPERQWMSFLIGTCLVAAGVSLATNWKSRWVGLLLSGSLIIRVLFIHLPKLVTNVHDPGPWTSGAEILSIAGGVLVLGQASFPERNKVAPTLSVRIGQILFALPLIVVAVQHFLYANFIATLIPSWIPARLFWAYFVGVAFFASTLAIVFRRFVPLAPALLGLMFFLWVLMLHLPRVVASAHNGSEWTSMFVALAMSGCSLAVAASFARRE